MRAISSAAGGAARRIAVALALAVWATAPAGARDPRDAIRIDDTLVVPENIASARDGTLWFGSVAKGTIYRAAPGQAVARAWIAGAAVGMARSMGLFADERRRLLWVCAPGARATAGTPGGPTAIRTFDLRTGAPRASYAFDGGGRCNDLTVARDGTVFAGDFDGGRVMRLGRGDDRFRVWAVDPRFGGVDGLALLDDGALYVDTFRTGRLFRIPVRADGGAGAPVAIATDRPLASPDGMRAVGPATLLLAEGAGRLTELTIAGDAARVRTIRDGIADSPAGVALVGDVAYVVQAQWSAMDAAATARPFGAVAVPYARPDSRRQKAGRRRCSSP